MAHRQRGGHQALADAALTADDGDGFLFDVGEAELAGALEVSGRLVRSPQLSPQEGNRGYNQT